MPKSAIPPAHPDAEQPLSFESLMKALAEADSRVRVQTSKAINAGLTLRNWIFGHLIHTYEMNGSDRAAYGEKLFPRLAEKMKAQGLSNVEERYLRRYVQFYLAYPQIRTTLSSEFTKLPQLRLDTIRPTVSSESNTDDLMLPGPELVGKLSYSMFAELLTINDPLKRAFYERQAIQSMWSVRELRRQMASLLYERTGLSSDKTEVVRQAGKGPGNGGLALQIRDPYIMEFLGIQSREVMSESDLENALLDKMQDFLLELGHGFCFEARQKRILIDDEWFFPDYPDFRIIPILSPTAQKM